MLEDGSRIHYDRISAGIGFTDAVYEHVGTQSRFYKSRMAWNGGGWDVTLADGTVYTFPFGDAAVRPQQAALIGWRDRYGNKTTFARDANGNLTRITSPAGRTIDFTYDASYRVIQARDNIGRAVSYAYDPSGRLWSVTDAAGGMTEYTYDSSHRMLTIKDARQIVFITNEYDTNGRVFRQTQADTTTYQFVYTTDPGTGKIIQTDLTDPRGFVRRLTFNTNGYLLTDTRALGQSITQTITHERQTGSNFILASTDGLARRTEFAYDAMGNVSSVTRLAGTGNAVTTTFTYEASFQRLATVTDPLSHTWTYFRDSLGNLTVLRDPLGNEASITYNTAGQPKTITTTAGTTEYAYEAGDLIAVTDPFGKMTTRFVDNAGRVAAITTPLGARTRYEYDALNRLTRIVDSLGGPTSFGYDPNGNLSSLTDARNNSTTYVYNNMDRLQTRNDPLLHPESYSYDNNGNLATFTDRKNQPTHATYDALNRLTQRTYADTSTTTYTWDAGNRLTEINDSLSGTIVRSYDGLDRITAETTPQGTVSYTYDAAGRRTSMTVAGQPTVNYSYDNADRLASVTQGTASVTIGYDTAGRRTMLSLPNATSTAYAYDAASRLTGLTYKAGTTTLGTLTYTYDSAGNRRVVDGTWARTALPASLAGATYNAANQQVTFGTDVLTYDLNGNLTNDGVSTYAWNVRNQLVSVTGPSVSTFGYDGLGRRRTKATNGNMTTLVYDGVNPVQEQHAGGAANLLTGPAVDEFYTRTDADGVRRYFSDALGSTVALSDSAGAVVATYTYEAFGKTTVNGTTPNVYDYTGREAEAASLKYYRTRYYHSQLQRFLSEDPVEFVFGSSNRYAYVLNNPANMTDPLGLFPTATHSAVLLMCIIVFGLVASSMSFLAMLAAGYAMRPRGSSIRAVHQRRSQQHL